MLSQGQMYIQDYCNVNVLFLSPAWHACFLFKLLQSPKTQTVSPEVVTCQNVFISLYLSYLTFPLFILKAKQKQKQVCLCLWLLL